MLLMGSGRRRAAGWLLPSSRWEMLGVDPWQVMCAGKVRQVGIGEPLTHPR